MSGARGYIARHAPGAVAALWAPLALVGLGAYLTRTFLLHPVIAGNDLRTLWLPTWVHLGESLRQGQVPLWDQHLALGRPFAADPQSGWLYLMPMAAFGLLSITVAIKAMIVLPPILAALALYAFCRSEGLPRVAAFSGGCALLGLLTPEAMLVRAPFEATILYALTTLLCASCLMRPHRPAVRAGLIALFGVSYSQAMSAHFSIGLLETTVLVTTFLIVKSFDRLRQGRDQALRLAARAAGLVLATTAISMGVLLPRLSFVGRTSLGQGYSSAWRLSHELAHAPISPDPVEHVAQNTSWARWLIVGSGSHVVLAGVVLALIGLGSARRGLALALGGLGVVSYVLSLGAVAQAVPQSWTRFRLFDVYRHGAGWFCYLLFVVLALLVALGVERLGRLPTATHRGRVAWAVLIVVAAVALIAAVVQSLSSSQISASAFALFGALMLAVIPLDARLLPLSAILVALPLVAGVPHLTPPAGMPEPLTGARADRPRPIDPLITVTAFQRQFQGTGRVAVYYRPGTLFQKYATAFPTPATTAFDQAEITGADTTSIYNALQLTRYWRTMRAYDHAQLHYNVTSLDHLSAPFADLLDIGWWVAPRNQPAPPGATLAAKRGPAALWRLQPPGLASLYPQWQGAASDSAAQDAAVGSGFSAGRTVLASGLRSGGAGGSRIPVASTVLGQDRIALTTASDSAGFLLVRESYDPGWQATVDGRSARVYAADGFMLGVLVPPGGHQIVLQYHDPTIPIGLAVSIAALLILLGGGWLTELRRRPAQADIGQGR